MIGDKEDKKGYNFAIERKYCPDNPISVVQASGEDALEFLQGQFTQDLSKLKDQASAYGFLLTQKGRVFGDAFLRRVGAEEWQMMSWSLPANELIARLNAYIIADDVELEDVTEGWRGWRVGPGDPGWIRREAGTEDGVELALAADLAMPWRIVVAAPGIKLTWAEGWEAGSLAYFEAARIVAGWPQVPIDLGPDDFPQEGGRHRAGVSFTKGCYLGQEVMARLAATGRLRRGLAHVSGRGSAPEGEMEFQQGSRAIGKLRSRVNMAADGWIGLAMLQLAHFDTAQPITDPAGGEVHFGGRVGTEASSA